MSEVEWPAMSAVEWPAMSAVEWPAMSEVEWPVMSAVEWLCESIVKLHLPRRKAVGGSLPPVVSLIFCHHLRLGDHMRNRKAADGSAAY